MAKTGVSKFRFISPGIQIAEIDNSQLPRDPAEMGPVIIGSAIQGPALRPVKVNSFSEFVEIFGLPQVGNKGGDIWRDGVFGLAPTYGAYAAQAWLRNNSAVTFVRLLGKANTDATLANGGLAGWKIWWFSWLENRRFIYEHILSFRWSDGSLAHQFFQQFLSICQHWYTSCNFLL